MAGHRFRRAHGKFLVRGTLSEEPLHGPRLNHVANRRGSTVRVDVANIFGREFGVLQRRFHHAKSAVAVFRRLGDMIRVTAHPVADNLRKNRRVAPLSMFERLQNQYPRTFSDHESISRGVEWATGLFWLIIARGKCTHGGKPAYAHRGNRRLSAAANHY